MHTLSETGEASQQPLDVNSYSGSPKQVSGSLVVLQAKLYRSATSAHYKTLRTSALARGNHTQAIDLPLVKEIASPANSYIKHCCKLVASRAYREQAGSVLVVGHIPVQEIAEFTSVRVLFLAQHASPPAGGA